MLFSVWCWKSRNILYSDNCHSCADLLGCISLRRQECCILNRQYTKAEYEKKAAEVIAALVHEGLWGEMLPVGLSPFAYNESAAFEYYPLHRDQVSALGWRWTDELPYTQGKETINWADLPDAIEKVDNSVLENILACTSCGRNYKINRQELGIYRKLPVPLPRNCPLCRHLARFARKTPTDLWKRKCSECEAPIITSYSPQRLEKVLCDECYFTRERQ